MIDNKPVPAIVSQCEETEQALIDQIKNMDSQTAWSIGAMISRLKSNFGLTDEEISSRTDLSREVVSQRRLVWETFSDCYLSYKNLKWTHFREALSWDDAPECLQWADEIEASIAEMKAWRRAQHGEDLTIEESPCERGSDSFVDDHHEIDPRIETAPSVASVQSSKVADDHQEERLPACAEREPPTVQQESDSVAESHNVTESSQPRTSSEKLDAAIQDCINIHEAILAVRKLSRAAVESYDTEQLQEFAIELKSCLKIVESRTRVTDE